jgi:hypothetical protein
MEFDDAVFDTFERLAEAGVLFTLEIEEARYIAACMELNNAFDRGADDTELAKHCTLILQYGERVCSRKSVIGITPMMKNIYFGLKRQVDAGESFD